MDKPMIRSGSARRAPLSVSQETLVRVRALHASTTLPLLVEAELDGVDLIAWGSEHREWIETQSLQHGGILFRNFRIGDGDLEPFIAAVSGSPLEYRERSSPRTPVSGHIYTSTEHPADQRIFLHNENSYQQTWPLKIFFFCVTAAARGGQTPIADCRGVTNRIAPATRERFAARGWMYVRNFGDGFGLPWQAVFQTSDPQVVDRYCREHGIQAEWRAAGRLRTRAVAPALARHPKTGETIWFNHATFFHVSTLAPDTRAALMREFAEEDLPANTYYGDGSPIEAAVLDELREAYRQETVAFPWRQGDVLMLDNMLVAHGREPYEGARKILVGMTEPVTRPPQ